MRNAPGVDTPARRRVVRLCVLFYLLLLAEGPLRKWVLPGASTALVFLRDPVMVLIMLAMAGLPVSAAGRRARAAFGVAALAAVACVTGQLAASDVPPLALLAGLRNYLLFVPVAWAVAETFTPADYARWIRLNLWLAGPVGLLVLLQYRSAPGAFINAVPGGGDEGVFLFVADVVRPYGLFSFTLGHSVYAAWMVAVLLAALSSRAIRAGRLAMGAGLGGTLLMGAFSGSRTFLLLAGTVVTSYLGAGLASRAAGARRRAALVAGALALSLAAVFVAVPDLAARLVERQDTAVAAEGGTGARIGQVVTEFLGEIDTVPPLGYGLGAGTNVANYLSNGRLDKVLAEYELTRLVQELGPFFGLGAILLRWGLAAALTLATLRAARRGNLQPAGFLGLVVPLLVAHDVTLQNSMIGIAWFATGILGAALRFDGSPITAAMPAPQLTAMVPRCA